MRRVFNPKTRASRPPSMRPRGGSERPPSAPRGDHTRYRSCRSPHGRTDRLRDRVAAVTTVTDTAARWRRRCSLRARSLKSNRVSGPISIDPRRLHAYKKQIAKYHSQAHARARPPATLALPGPYRPHTATTHRRRRRPASRVASGSSWPASVAADAARLAGVSSTCEHQQGDA